MDVKLTFATLDEIKAQKLARRLMRLIENDPKLSNTIVAIKTK